jgi:hypothetical protein
MTMRCTRYKTIRHEDILWADGKMSMEAHLVKVEDFQKKEEIGLGLASSQY